MEENMQMEKELSLLDLMKVLLSKIKILILTVIIGAMIGSLFAVWTTIDVDYYGTTVEFYVNPESEKDEGDADSANSQYAVYGSYGRNVMDAITYLLASESFT